MQSKDVCELLIVDGNGDNYVRYKKRTRLTKKAWALTGVAVVGCALGLYACTGEQKPGAKDIFL